MSLRGLCAALVLTAAVLPASLVAQPMEEVDYVLVDPSVARAGERIEVIEFFYYGCSSCRRFEPLLEEWLAGKPADVDFRRVPALRRTEWIPLARLFFALEELGASPRLHAEAYRALHDQGRDLASRSVAAEWAASQGLDRARFEQALMSDAVTLKVQKARDTTVRYGVRVTPSLTVDGRFLTSAALVGDIAQLVPVLDALVDMARGSRAGPDR
jgi:thiol:disulfide interchange protein DsbA